MGFRKTTSGDYYYFAQHGTVELLVKHSTRKLSTRGALSVFTPSVPAELIGKKVKLKMEVLR